MINYASKVNERLIGVTITSESHIVGILATATYMPGQIRLIEVPQQDDPSTVTIPGYTEITVGSPTGTQFIVDYVTGVITFDTAQDGNTVMVSYTGLGSEIAAEDINEIQNPLGTIATQSITYNWPSAPTVSWSLAANIVIPTSISNVSTNDFTFPRDVFVTRNLVTPDVISTTSNPAHTGVLRLANNTDTVSWRNAGNTADLSLTVNGSNQLVFNGSPLEISTLTDSHIFVGNGSNVATDVALSGDASLADTGALTVLSVGGSTAANIHTSQLATAAATAADTASTLVLRDSSGNFAAGTITASLTGHSSLDLALSGGTMSGNIDMAQNQVLHMVIQTGSTEPGSPIEGQVFYNTTTHQAEVWNGSSWSIMG